MTLLLRIKVLNLPELKVSEDIILRIKVWNIPELEVCEDIIVENQSLEVDQPPHLRREGGEVVVWHVQVDQVRAVHEYAGRNLDQPIK